MVLRKVAVTGASGMVGRHVLAALDDAGINIAASSRTRPATLPDGALWTSWDLSEWKTGDELDQIFDGPDAIVHVGAAVPSPTQGVSRRALFDTNVRASLALGEWAESRDIPLVYISGATVYADPEAAGISEQAPIAPGGIGGFYGSTKFFAEQVLESLREDGLRCCVLRPSSVYGEGMANDKMITGFLTTAARGKRIELANPIGDRVNLVHASDVARAVLLSLMGACRGIYNVPGPGLVTIEEIALTCVQVVGKGDVGVREGPSPRNAHSRFDLEGSVTELHLGYCPQTDLVAGLTLMWERKTTCA